MTKHKWYDEIVAWASGAEIEYRYDDEDWVVMSTPTWQKGARDWYRIKKQPVQQKYLYVYQRGWNATLSTVRNEEPSQFYLGKIEVKP